MKITAVIPARGGSKRLKGKNIAEVWEKPMLYWAIKACKDSNFNIDIWVSTEDDKIKAVAKSYGAKIHDRDPVLASDTAFKQEVIRSAASFIDKITGPSEVYISLQPNSPQITGAIIDSAVEKLLKHDCSEIFSVNKDLMQNAAIRVFRGRYVYQKDLSTYCGVIVCDIEDIHTKEDLERVENARKRL